MWSGARQAIGVLQQMELDLQPGAPDQALLGKPCQHAAQQGARGKRVRRAVGAIEVAQNPAAVRRPGQHVEAGGVGDHDHVAGAVAAGLENRKRGAAGQVLQQHGHRAGDAGAQCTHRLGRDQRLAADHAMRVGKGEAHDAEFLDPRNDLRGRVLLARRSTGRAARRNRSRRLPSGCGGPAKPTRAPPRASWACQ